MKTLNDYLAMSYRMEIVEDKDEGGFVVSYPELPGCITCGETIERAVENAADAEKLNLMLWKIYMVSSRKEEFVTAAKKELQPYLTKKDEKQIDTTYDTTYTIDRRH